MNALDPGPAALEAALRYAITPVVLVSAVGLLLLTLANRLGRAIDRSRELARAADQAGPDERPAFDEQLGVVVRRARWLREAVVLAALSLLLSCAMILLMLVQALSGWPMGGLIVAAFGLDALALMGSLVFFVRELLDAVSALEIEVARRSDALS
jgi:hypothetical protein